ncbi:DUF5677 domain-containing protein [Streptomyces sp. NPDC001288]|uniref:DUF5677 domain-containing protein n=1 Tax=Streptomyces sp. NPDC001297 TaxID=3364559 RepID=UPI0036B2946D
MAISKERNKNPRRRPGAQEAGNPQVRHTASPKGRLSPFFELLGEIAAAAERAIQSTPHPSDQLVRFDIEILMRGANSVKAVRALLEQGHWEHAVGVTRQLFELLVNMEYLGTMADRRQGTLLFARFGMLQMLLAQQRRAAYERDKGHPLDAELAAMVEHHLANDFTVFRANTKDGSVKWVSSWCRRNTSQLADASADPMRPHQYNLLYRVWSEQAHATPGALIADLFREADEGWIERTIAENDRSSIDTITFTVMFFLRLWLELPHVQVSHERVAGWLSKLSTMNGGPDLPSRPWSPEEAAVQKVEPANRDTT